MSYLQHLNNVCVDALRLLQPQTCPELPPAPHLQGHPWAGVLDLGKTAHAQDSLAPRARTARVTIPAQRGRVQGCRPDDRKRSPQERDGSSSPGLVPSPQLHFVSKVSKLLQPPSFPTGRGCHDVIFSKPACRKACLLSFGVGKREGEELLGRTGDLISTQQNRPHTLPTGYPLPGAGHRRCQQQFSPGSQSLSRYKNTLRVQGEFSSKQACLPKAGVKLGSP